MSSHRIDNKLTLLIQVVGGLLIGLILTAPILFGVMALIHLGLQAPFDPPFEIYLALLIYPTPTSLGVVILGRAFSIRGTYWPALVAAYGATIALVYVVPVVLFFFRLFCGEVCTEIGFLFLLAIPSLIAALQYRYRSLSFMDVESEDEEPVDLSAIQQSGLVDY